MMWRALWSETMNPDTVKVALTGFPDTSWPHLFAKHLKNVISHMHLLHEIFTPASLTYHLSVNMGMFVVL